MTHTIVRLKQSQAPAHRAIGLALKSSGTGPEERLHHLLPAARIPARTRLVLLWRGEPLSSPDTIAVTGSSISDQEINLQIEQRRFDGPLHMNIVTVPVVELDLGSLEPGQYEVMIDITDLLFRELDHPEHAANASTQHMSFAFTVV